MVFREITGKNLLSWTRLSMGFGRVILVRPEAALKQ
jgi:hypothetical protein